MSRLPKEWEIFLNQDNFDIYSFYRELEVFLNRFEFIIPTQDKIFNVFNYVNPAEVTCVLYGEDPYPRLSSACGVAFWDMEIKNWDDKTNGNSLKNILKALLVASGKATYKTSIEECRKIAVIENIKSPPGLFELWLNQGILLVNTSLTFSGSKFKKEHFIFWQPFHKQILKALNNRNKNPYYILWGSKAQKWENIIIESIDDRSKIIKQGHPTFIHQFLDPANPYFSPFTEIINKTKLNWI